MFLKLQYQIHLFFFKVEDERPSSAHSQISVKEAAAGIDNTEKVKYLLANSKFIFVYYIYIYLYIIVYYEYVKCHYNKLDFFNSDIFIFFLYEYY